MKPILKSEAGQKSELMRAGMRQPHFMSSAYSLGALIVMFCVILSGECLAYPTPNVASVYYSSTDNPLALNANVGQCTWYVYGRIQETGLITYSKLSSLGIFTGGADTWYANATTPAAIAAGFTTGSQPKLGAIAYWNTGGNKHVAFVENASGPQVTESNFTPTQGYQVVIDGYVGYPYVKLHSDHSAPSSVLWTVPQFTVMNVTGPSVTPGDGYQWFPLSANDGNPNHTGWAALLDANTGLPASNNFIWNFTRIQLSPGALWIANPSGYIYLPSSDNTPPTVNLTYPNTGTFSVGNQINITATASDASGISYCGYYLYKSGTALGIIYQNSPGGGLVSSYPWTVPATFNGYTINGTDYQICFAAWDASPNTNGNAVLSSGYITLQPVVTPVLNIITSAAITEGDTGSKWLWFTVTLSPASSQTVTVNYATANGTATAGSDYTATSSTLTFTPGQTSQQVYVPILGDYVIEGDETFTMTLSGAVNATIGTGTATGTILNDDVAGTLTLSSSTYSVNENAGPVTVTVNRTGGLASGVGVNYATSNGTAMAGSDYTSTSGTLTFNGGETSKTFTVTILDDAVYEGNETFAVNLSGATGASLGSPATATVTIVDNETPPLGISKQGTSMIFSWPTSATGFTLQSTTNLGTAAVWGAVSPSPVVVNGQNVVTNPMSGSRMFFRLMHP